MIDRDWAKLFGYLVGALDDDERRQMHEQLKHDPKLRRDLAKVRAQVRPLRATHQQATPPAGLAERTCRLVRSLAAMEVAEKPCRPSPARQRACRMSPEASPPASVGWRWIDVAVAAMVLVAATLAILPAVQSVRSRSQLIACQDSLRTVGVHVAQLHQSRTAIPPRIATPPQWAASFTPGHQGINPYACGQNLLYADGRAAFFATATWEPAPVAPASFVVPNDSGRTPAIVPVTLVNFDREPQ